MTNRSGIITFFALFFLAFGVLNLLQVWDATATSFSWSAAYVGFLGLNPILVAIIDFILAGLLWRVSGLGWWGGIVFFGISAFFAFMSMSWVMLAVYGFMFIVFLAIKGKFNQDEF